LVYGFAEVSQIQKEFERTGRGEKTTSFRMKASLSFDEIKTITADYLNAAAAEGESVSTYFTGENGVALDVKYNELDLSKTTLRQLQKRQAHIEVQTVGEETIITYASTEKARAIAKSISKRINSIRSSSIEVEEIDFSTFNAPRAKSEFFYMLVTTLPDFRLDNVTSVKVDSNQGAPAEQNEIEDSPETGSPEGSQEGSPQEAGASGEMLAVVRAVALQGESLLSSSEYQTLQGRGFFISRIRWSAQRLSSPYQKVEFEASFADPTVGCGFLYSVLGWSTQKNGTYTKGFNSIPENDKKQLMQMLEDRSMALFKQLRADALAAAQRPDDDVVGEPDAIAI
jgi:hypothetical protein